MILSKVVGTIVPGQQVENISGIKFLLLEKIDPVSLKGKGDYVVSMDAVGAGPGEIVFFVSGSSARLAPATAGLPTDSTVIAIVDNIEKSGKFTYQKSKTN